MTEPKKSPPPPAGVARVPTRKSTLPEAELRRYRDSGSLIQLQPGDVLYEQGTAPEELFLVLTGTLTVIQDGVPIAEIGPTELAGDLAFFLQLPRSATVRAATGVELYPLTPKKLIMLLRNTELGAQIVQLYALRVEAVNKALTMRTQRVLSLEMKLEELGETLEEEQRQRAVDVATLNGKLDAAVANLEAADARIKQLELALGTANLEIAQDGTVRRTFPRPAEPEAASPASTPALELEMDDGFDGDLAALAPPPAPLPIGKISLTQVVVPQPKPALVFTEEGPTEQMPVIPDTDIDVVVEGPFAEDEPPTSKTRRDEKTLSYATERSGPGPIRARRQGAVSVGGRTQSMAAFDPDAPRMEITIDENGARVTSPPAVSNLDRETDSLIAEILRITPDTTPKK